MVDSTRENGEVAREMDRVSKPTLTEISGTKVLGLTVNPGNATFDTTLISSCTLTSTDTVCRQVLLDLQGVKGLCTGVVCRSTGMLHGFGRRVCEDGTIYIGNWYV
jgi:hypothetical protein